MRQEFNFLFVCFSIQGNCIIQHTHWFDNGNWWQYILWWRRLGLPCKNMVESGRGLLHGIGKEAEHSTSFWMAVKELENANESSEFQSTTKTLIKCRDTKWGLSCKESDLIKLTRHPTLSMYTSADIRREFEATARPFWKEWAEFERILTFLPEDATCKGHTQLLCKPTEQRGKTTSTS